MPIVNILVDATSNHRILPFMDEQSKYNQVFIVKHDIHKITFRCPSVLGVYEWVMMSFDLKNAGTAYQKAMNGIFHDLTYKSMEVNLDDVVVKLRDVNQYLADLEQAFIRKKGSLLEDESYQMCFWSLNQ